MAFDSAFLKVQRAQMQREQLRKEITAFFQSDDRPFEIILEDDPDSGQRVVFRVTRDTPPLWPVIIGEILHDLRSALDHLVHEASVKDAKGEAPWGTEFPIFVDERLYKVEARGGGLYKIRGLPAAFKALVERLQPFKYGEAPHLHQLWVLHELSNIDKHRLLHLTYAVHGLAELDLELPPTLIVEELKIREDGPIEDGAVLASWGPVGIVAGAEHARMAVKAQVAHHIAFRETNPAFGGWNAEGVLDQVGQFVGAVVHEFRKIA